MRFLPNILGDRASGPQQQQWRITAMVLLLLLAAVFVTYGNTLANDFVWDDIHLIAGDARLQSVEYLPSIFSNDYFAFKDDVGKYGYYRPIATVSFMLDRALYGLRPLGFHLTNIWLHFCCCALMFLVGRKVFPNSQAIAAIGALFFAIHPVHTENVAWISGRTDLLSTAFVLGNWLLADLSRVQNGWRRAGWTALACVAFMAGLLAKEMALGFVAIYYLWLRRDGCPRRLAVSTTVPIALTAFAYFLWRLYAVAVQMNHVTARPAHEFLATAAKTLWRYVGELIYPLPLVAHIENPWIELISWQGILASLGVVAAIGLIFSLRHNKNLVFLCLGFAAALIPVSNVVTLGAALGSGFPIAERFLYLPSVFFCWGVTWAVHHLWHHTRGVLAFAAVLCVACVAISIQRNSEWRTSRTFFESTLRHAPNSFTMLGSLAFVDLAEHRYQDAETNFNKALDAHRQINDGEDVRLVTGLALTHLFMDKPHVALTMAQAFESKVSIPVLTYVVAESHRRLGQLDEAEVAFLRCISHHANFPNAYVGLARIATSRGDYDQALGLFEKTLSLAGQVPEVYVAMGDVHRMQGDKARALSSYARALALNPKLASAEAATGVILAEQGDIQQATVALERALALDSQLYSAEVTLAILLAQQGRLREAEERIRMVLQAEPENRDALFNLAILFANTHRLPEARAVLLDLLKRMPGHREAARLLLKIDQQDTSRGPNP
ncbi:MAG: hypothetical protein A2341_05030 [Deltaproteobacteria bacterium RIFOXYB12_FULL_58_9]|nr:MAG: hypothetical protein A2341_05030 [Deltaproteobacteria bacterium RIFOXYB12_FULL_58_9]